MIREKIEKINHWYNRKGAVIQRRVLSFFCLSFVMLGWISLRFITFDTKKFQQKVPVNIGSPSGLPPADTVKLNKH